MVLAVVAVLQKVARGFSPTFDNWGKLMKCAEIPKSGTQFGLHIVQPYSLVVHAMRLRIAPFRRVRSWNSFIQISSQQGVCLEKQQAQR